MRRSRPQDGSNGRSAQPAASNSKPNLLSILEGAENLNREYEIDTILSSNAPPAAMGDVGSFLDRLPPAGPKPLGMAMGPMTAVEEAQLIADVYGRQPPDAALTEERLDELEREIGRLDREERTSLDKVLRRHPLLTVASPHVRMMIREDDFDAAAAAQRLARYWRQRESVFGSRAFSTGLFTQPDFNDYIRHYNKCLRAMDDPELDTEMRDMAKEYVRVVGRVKIEALDKWIENAPENDREALMEARRIHPEVVESEEHKLLFLKCENFVEARAADRLMKYWAMKKLLFGTDRLGRDITLADVESSVFELNMECHSLLVPDTDEAGRAVFWVSPKEVIGKVGWTAEGMIQYMWCVCHIALARPSCREHGIVFMINAHGWNSAEVDRTSAMRRLGASLQMHCMPFRVRVVHIFFAPSAWWQKFMLGMLSKFSTFANKRMVVHIGTFEENKTVLEEQFGIGPDQVVEEMGGNVGMNSWRGWIRKRKEEGL